MMPQPANKSCSPHNNNNDNNNNNNKNKGKSRHLTMLRLTISRESTQFTITSISRPNQILQTLQNKLLFLSPT